MKCDIEWKDLEWSIIQVMRDILECERPFQRIPFEGFHTNMYCILLLFQDRSKLLCNPRNALGSLKDDPLLEAGLHNPLCEALPRRAPPLLRQHPHPPHAHRVPAHRPALEPVVKVIGGRLPRRLS